MPRDLLKCFLIKKERKPPGKGYTTGGYLRRNFIYRNTYEL